MKPIEIGSTSSSNQISSMCIGAVNNPVEESRWYIDIAGNRYYPTLSYKFKMLGYRYGHDSEILEPRIYASCYSMLLRC